MSTEKKKAEDKIITKELASDIRKKYFTKNVFKENNFKEGILMGLIIGLISSTLILWILNYIIEDIKIEYQGGIFLCVTIGFIFYVYENYFIEIESDKIAIVKNFRGEIVFYIGEGYFFPWFGIYSVEKQEDATIENRDIKIVKQEDADSLQIDVTASADIILIDPILKKNRSGRSDVMQLIDKAVRNTSQKKIKITKLNEIEKVSFGNDLKEELTKLRELVADYGYYVYDVNFIDSSYSNQSSVDAKEAQAQQKLKREKSRIEAEDRLELLAKYTDFFKKQGYEPKEAAALAKEEVGKQKGDTREIKTGGNIMMNMPSSGK